MQIRTTNYRTKTIKIIAAAAIMISTSLTAIPAVSFAETNLAEITRTNPSGLIPISLYPAASYDASGADYWVSAALNKTSFPKLRELVNTTFTFSKTVLGDAYENRHNNGVASSNIESLIDILNWTVDTEQSFTVIAHLGTHTSPKPKLKIHAISQASYDQLNTNLEQLKKQLPAYQNKIAELDGYLNWLQSLSSNDLKKYLGAYNFNGTMTIFDMKELNYANLLERLEILKYNMAIVDRLVIGRNDLPSIWVQPADRLIEIERSIGYLYCDDGGYPYKFTLEKSPTLTFPVKVRAVNIEYKMVVYLDGKRITSTYDEVLGRITAPTNGLSLGNHNVNIFVASPDEDLDQLSHPIADWTFEVYDNNNAQGSTSLPGNSNNSNSNNSNSNNNNKPPVTGAGASVRIEGKELTAAGAKPLSKDNRMLAPVRAFFDGMGAETKWDPKAGSVTSTLSKGNETVKITLMINSAIMYKEYTRSDGVKQTFMKPLDVPAQIINGSTYIPIRAAAEAFGYQLEWNAAANVTSLKYSGSMKETTNSANPAYTVIGNVSLLTDSEREVFMLVNHERMKNGLKPLALNADLSLLARKKSKDMLDKNYFDHKSPAYGSPADMLSKAGFKWKNVGENIAFGQKTAAEVMEAWMKSPGHRANILNTNYEQIGIGFVQEKGSLLWTQHFYTPQS